MCAQIDKSRVPSITNMFIPSPLPGEHLGDHHQTSGSRATETCAEYFQSWNSRVSFPPENRLSSESLVCRTMRRDSGECENVYKNTKSHQKINNRLSSSSNISSDTISSSMLEKSIGNLARLFVKSSSSSINTDYCSHYNSKFICPSTSTTSKKVSPSSSSTAHCTMSHSHHHHHWSSQFGIVLVAILLLSSFSSTTVMCVPIGNEGGSHHHHQGIGDGDSKLVEYSRKLNSQQGQNSEPVSISSHVSGQQPMYLPDSIYKNGEDDEMVTMGNKHLYQSSSSSDIPTQSNYHQFLKKASNIQKPVNQHQKHHKDIPRSVHLDQNDPEDGDSDEMENEILPSSSQFGRARHENDDPIILGASNDEDDEDAVGAMDQSASGQWETVIDPHLYLLTEWGNPNGDGNRKYMETEIQPRRQLLQKQGKYSMFRQQRKRRNSGSGPSLSIVNPLDVLRQRLLLEIARRRMRQSHNQIIANEEILRKIGRR